MAAIGNSGYVHRPLQLGERKLECGNVAKKAIVDILQQSQPIHHRQLIKQISLANVNLRWYFRQLGESQIFHWFKLHPKTFWMPNDGYVFLVPDESTNMVEEQFKILKSAVLKYFSEQTDLENTKQHYLYLINFNSGVFVVHRYFRSLSDAEKFWFFKNNPDVFLVENTGYVSLKSRTARIIQSLITVLDSEKSMHFLKLIHSISTSYIDNNFFNDFTVSEKCNFVKKNSEYFYIRNNGYVYLQSEVRKIIQSAITLLQKNKCMHYLSIIQQTTHPYVLSSDINMKDFFDLCSNRENFQFFINQSNIFIEELPKGYISLTSDFYSQGNKYEGTVVEENVKEFKNEGVENYVEEDFENKCMHEIAKNAISNVLQQIQPIHFLNLIKQISSTNVKIQQHFSHYDESTIFHWFKSYPKHFWMTNDGYVFFVPDESTNMMEEQFVIIKSAVLKYFIKQTDLEHTKQHYLRVINSNSRIYAVKRYFSSLSDSEKFKFFKNNPDIFLVKNSGYVSLRPKTDRIIKLLISVLNSEKSMHFLKLTQSISTSDLDGDFFNDLTVTEKFNFFKKNSKYFYTRNNGYVYLQSQVEIIIQLVITLLQKNKSMHYLSIIQQISDMAPDINIKDFFSLRSNIENLYFFTNYPNTFIEGPSKEYISLKAVIDNEDYVVESEIHAANDQDVDHVQDIDVVLSDEEKVIIFLNEVLTSSNPQHYDYLCKLVSGSGKEFASFFEQYSTSMKYHFFRNLPNTFVIENDGYVHRATKLDEKICKKKYEHIAENANVDLLQKSQLVHNQIVAEQISPGNENKAILLNEDVDDATEHEADTVNKDEARAVETDSAHAVEADSLHAVKADFLHAVEADPLHAVEADFLDEDKADSLYAVGADFLDEDEADFLDEDETIFVDEDETIFVDEDETIFVDEDEIDFLDEDEASIDDEEYHGSTVNLENIDEIENSERLEEKPCESSGVLVGRSSPVTSTESSNSSVLITSNATVFSTKSIQEEAHTNAEVIENVSKYERNSDLTSNANSIEAYIQTPVHNQTKDSSSDPQRYSANVHTLSTDDETSDIKKELNEDVLQESVKDSSLENKSIHFFLIYLSQFKNGASCSKLQQILKYASKEVIDYVHFQNDLCCRQFFETRSKYFAIDHNYRVCSKVPLLM